MASAAKKRSQGARGGMLASEAPLDASMLAGRALGKTTPGLAREAAMTYGLGAIKLEDQPGPDDAYVVEQYMLKREPDVAENKMVTQKEVIPRPFKCARCAKTYINRNDLAKHDKHSLCARAHIHNLPHPGRLPGTWQSEESAVEPPVTATGLWQCPRCYNRYSGRWTCMRHIDNCCWKNCDECCAAGLAQQCDAKKKNKHGEDESCTRCKDKGIECTRHTEFVPFCAPILYGSRDTPEQSNKRNTDEAPTPSPAGGSRESKRVLSESDVNLNQSNPVEPTRPVMSPLTPPPFRFTTSRGNQGAAERSEASNTLPAVLEPNADPFTLGQQRDTSRRRFPGYVVPPKSNIHSYIVGGSESSGDPSAARNAGPPLMEYRTMHSHFYQQALAAGSPPKQYPAPNNISSLRTTGPVSGPSIRGTAGLVATRGHQTPLMQQSPAIISPAYISDETMNRILATNAAHGSYANAYNYPGQSSSGHPVPHGRVSNGLVDQTLRGKRQQDLWASNDDNKENIDPNGAFFNQNRANSPQILYGIPMDPSPFGPELPQPTTGYRNTAFGADNQPPRFPMPNAVGQHFSCNSNMPCFMDPPTFVQAPVNRPITIFVDNPHISLSPTNKFHTIRLHPDQKFGPELQYYCARLGKLYRQQWNFVYWFSDPKPDDPTHETGILLKYNETPTTFFTRGGKYDHGRGLRNGSVIEVVDSSLQLVPRYRSEFARSVSAEITGSSSFGAVDPSSTEAAGPSSTENQNAGVATVAKKAAREYKQLQELHKNLQKECQALQEELTEVKAHNKALVNQHHLSCNKIEDLTTQLRACRPSFDHKLFHADKALADKRSLSFTPDLSSNEIEEERHLTSAFLENSDDEEFENEDDCPTPKASKQA